MGHRLSLTSRSNKNRQRSRANNRIIQQSCCSQTIVSKLKIIKLSHLTKPKTNASPSNTRTPTGLICSFPFRPKRVTVRFGFVNWLLYLFSIFSCFLVFEDYFYCLLSQLLAFPPIRTKCLFSMSWFYFISFRFISSCITSSCQLLLSWYLSSFTNFALFGFHYIFVHTHTEPTNVSFFPFGRTQR